MNWIPKFTCIDTECYTNSGLIDSFPYRFVCQIKCEDYLRVAWEDEGLAPLDFPRYISKEERHRLRQLRLAEEEAKCPTHTMPGAFSAQ